MDDMRVDRLEERIRQLEIAAGRISVSSEHLAQTVDKFSDVVQDLRDTMNKGRGALWAITAAAGIVGGMVSLVARKFLGA